MKTRADLFRDLKKGNKELLKTIHYGKTVEELILQNKNNRFIKNMTEWRSVSKIQTNSISLDGSWLDIPAASLVEYDGDTIKIYDVGYRHLTAEEQAVMEEWRKITQTERYKQDAYNDIMTDGSTTYYQDKRFFENSKYPYLNDCSDFKNGKKYTNVIFLENNCRLEGDFILDKSIKGLLLMAYAIREKEDN